MLWQNASACTVAVRTPEPGSRTQLSFWSVRMVVAPSRFLQYAAKSCSPTIGAAASFMASTSNGRSCHST